MAEFGNYVIYVIMACAVAGAIASIIDDQHGLGKEFIQGINSIGPIFLPVAGIMASIPFLSAFIKTVFGPVFQAIGADPAMAATTIIAVDMGGYQLARELAHSTESWLMASVVGYTAGATIVFYIPVGLALLSRKNYKYMALGMMSGILSVPISVFVTCAILSVTNLVVRDTVAVGVPDYSLQLEWGVIFANLMPLVVFCIGLALGLRFMPDFMIKAFMVFGRILYAAITLVVVFSIVEYFTHVFSKTLGWGFDGLIADKEDQMRALEISGYIGIMLAGAFPMVYLINKYLARPMTVIGKRIGIGGPGAAGMLASTANILAMFRIIDDMTPKDKVLNIAFVVCAGAAFGDHLAFTANFQPTMILPILIGKLVGGASGFLLAYWLSVPKAIQLGEEDARLEKAA